MSLLIGFSLGLGFCGLIGTIFFSLVSVPESWLNAAPFFFTGWVPPTERFLMWTVLQALGSLVAVSCLIRGYQVAEPTYVGVFEYSFLIFAGFWGWILWQEIPDVIGFLGISAIVVAGIIISIRARVSSTDKATINS